jgi:uncharacterized membrane protein
MMQQLIRYGLVGLANTAFGLSLIYLAMSVFGLAPALANAVGFAADLLAPHFPKGADNPNELDDHLVEL